MRLGFPTADALRRAIDGPVSPGARRYPARAHVGDDGRILIETGARLLRADVQKLRALGVLIDPPGWPRPEEEVRDWLQLLPLTPDPDPPPPDSVVRFELADAGCLPGLAAEMRRLGCRDQSAAWSGGGVMVRAAGPPHFSLLRALERTDPEAPRAFVERAPGVFVELGWRFGPARLVAPPPGRLLKLRPPRVWGWVDDAPLTPLYPAADYRPDGPPRRRPAGEPRRLPLALRLVRGRAEPAELWVLRDRPLESVAALAADADGPTVEELRA